MALGRARALESRRIASALSLPLKGGLVHPLCAISSRARRSRAARRIRPELWTGAQPISLLLNRRRRALAGGAGAASVAAALELGGRPWTGVQVTLWQLSREKSLIAKRCEMKGNSGHTSKANFGSDICEFESSRPSQPVRSLLFHFPVCENRRHS